MQIQLKNVRLAFPELFEPKSVNSEGAPAFSATLLIDPKNPQIKDIKAAIEAVAKDKWGAKAGATLKTLQANNKLALHDGNLKTEYAGFEGNFYISARSKTRPLVIDQDKSALTALDGKPYAGCYVNASIEFWAQDNNYGKRINAQLRGVQFAHDGEPFGGGSTASVDEFDEVESEESATLEDDIPF